MTRSPALPALALILALAAASGPGRAEDADARYEALLALAKAGGANVDWRALRFAFADRPGYTASDDGDERTHAMTMRQDYATGDYAGAIVEAGRLADLDFVDPEPHLIASLAYGKSGDHLSAAREEAIAVGLLDSIKTGTGESGGTAFTVISVKEEYVLMATHGRKVTHQSLQRLDGHSYDVLETLDAAGNPSTYWFQIDRVIAAESHVLSLPKAK